MSFANPNIFFFLLLIPIILAVFIMSERSRNQHVNALVNPNREAMVMGAGFERRLVYMILLLIGITFLVVAAARPLWGTKLEMINSRGIDILVAVDTSESMRATDVSPDRISKARQMVDKFLNLLEGDRVGLIAFAGSAYNYCPLTVDYSALRLFLSGLEPGVISDAGTDVSAAIKEAIRTFERSESTAHKVLVIFSDGEHHEGDPTAAIKEATDAGIQVFTVGIGNVGKAGERIPLQTDGDTVEYKMDRNGNLVITKLDEETLKMIAQMGGGDYYRVSEAGTELIQIYKTLAENEETEFSSRKHHQKEERYQIPLLLGALFLISAYSLSNRSFRKMRRTQGVVS